MLQHYDSVFRNDFMRRVARAGNSPRERLLAVFDVAESWFNEEPFYGCMFINAIGEYAETPRRFDKICKQFKRLMRDYFCDFCLQSGAKDPDTLADEIALLFQGAIVTAQVSRASEAARTAKKAASVLMQHALM